MPRRNRHAAFDITDEPDDCYDATGQFPHLTTTPVTRDETGGERPARNRTIAYLALTLAATSAGAVALAPHATSDTPPPHKRSRPNPRPQRIAAIVQTPEPTRPTRPKVKDSAKPRPRAVAPKPTAQPAPSARVSSVRQRPVATTPPEPTGGEFILGAR